MLRRVLKKVSSVIAALFLMVVAFVTSVPTSELAHAAVVGNDLDSTSVESDLGEDFNWLLYPENKLGEIDVLQFVEYCYTDDVSEKGNYGLYLYIYNPALLRFSANNNVVNMAVAYDENGTPIEYSNVPLRLCGYSHGDYAFRVYKFRISLPASVYVNAKTSNEKNGYRQYDIASIQLRVVGETLSDDNTVARSFRCSGYAKGCDETSMNESTYACTWEKAETLGLDVESTFYRPTGTNGKTEWHQDTLHSVYFAVPNSIIEEYGRMYAVHATWLNAVLAPGLVAGNFLAYTAMLPFLGEELPKNEDGSHLSDLGYAYFGGCEGAGSGYSEATTFYGYSYNGGWDYHGPNMIHKYYGDEVNPLYFLYWSGNGDDSADKYVVSSELIKQTLKSSYEKYGGALIDGKYSEYIFSSIDSSFTTVNIKADDTFALTDCIIDKSWWDKLFGFEVADKVTASFDSVRAIYPVQESDFEGTDETIARRLYINEADLSSFRDFYEMNKKDSTIYLFRYQVSDYISQEATLYHYIEDGDIFTGSGWQKADTNAYFFQQTVNLSFDIIDVTFSDNGDYTVIPVVSDPIDIVNDANPPVHTKSDGDPDWSKILLGLLVLVVIVFAVITWAPRLLISFFKMIWKGISTFFRKIGQALKRLFRRRR